MSWSAAEVMALAQKAARGAGAPPAQAARFGQVAAAHLMAGRDAGLLEAALEALPRGPVVEYALALDRCLSDGHAGEPAPLMGVDADDLLVSYVEVLPFAARVAASPTGAPQLSFDPTTPRAKTAPKRIRACDDLIARMTALAERTYVPESAQSRSAGAGAGISDND